ncbi:MAG TPA: DNA replication/repair protein RecF [Chloroflexota bacterium]|nr:DNA replication/repair protein RecF [Chloroflexota bacterium]
MHVSRLRLFNFRNYASLDLPLQPGLTVLYGQNAQGKTNVLEAVHLLSSGSSYRAISDKEVIRWEAPDAERLARATGEVAALQETMELELAVTDMPGLATKRALVNGVGKRLGDFVGRLTAVLFGPEQLDLVTGSPSQRRGYFDGALSQTDHAYFRALGAYGRVLQQRNQLLKQFRERDVHPDELVYWDAQLVEAGSLISQARARGLQQLAVLAREQHQQLAPDGGELAADYETKLFRGSGGWRRLAGEPAEAVQAEFRAWLALEAEREMAQGSSVVGPHRDDLLLSLDGKPVDKFGSRGQQRTVALALKLAELEFLRQHTGEKPVLLLDDVLSELDEARRGALRDVVRQHEQVLLTTTERPELDATAAYLVRQGTLTAT